MSTADTLPASSPNEDLGRLLARLRSERGLVQKKVAQLAAIDGSTLSRLESGDRGVSREVLDRICNVLDLEPSERLDVLVAAGLVTEFAARFLADEDLAHMARLLHDPSVAASDASVFREYLHLALAHARALGYHVD